MSSCEVTKANKKFTYIKHKMRDIKMACAMRTSSEYHAQFNSGTINSHHYTLLMGDSAVSSQLGNQYLN